MANLLDKDIVRGIMSAAEALLEPNDFILKYLFKNTESFATTKVDLDLYKGKRRVAGYVRRYEEGNFVEKIGYTTQTLEPPYLKPKEVIRPSDLYKRLPGEMISTGSSARTAALTKLVAQKMQELDDIIVRNEQVQANQALWEGKVTAFDNDGDTLFEVDFGRDSSLADAQVSTLWSANGADPLKDLKAMGRASHKKSGFKSDFCFMGEDAADKFLSLTAVQQGLSKDWSRRGELAYELDSLGGIWLGRADGLDIWAFDETYLDLITETEKTLFPAKKVLVGSTRAMATRLYGGIEHNSSLNASPRYFSTYDQEDPNGTVIQLHSAPLMVLKHPDAYCVRTVLT